MTQPNSKPTHTSSGSKHINPENQTQQLTNRQQGDRSIRPIHISLQPPTHLGGGQTSAPRHANTVGLLPGCSRTEQPVAATDACSESRPHGGKHRATAANHSETNQATLLMSGGVSWCLQDGWSFFLFKLQRQIWAVFPHRVWLSRQNTVTKFQNPTDILCCDALSLHSALLVSQCSKIYKKGMHTPSATKLLSQTSLKCRATWTHTKRIWFFHYFWLH